MNKLLLGLILLSSLPTNADQTGCVQGDCVNGTGIPIGMVRARIISRVLGSLTDWFGFRSRQ